jgi:glucose-1-phosphate thymidylyltransferase
MKALILAAGYATRLYPLTKDRPKPLLRVGDSTIIDHLIAKFSSLGAVDGAIVVTNDRFYPQFQDWALEISRSKVVPFPVTVVNDGTQSNETRLGAIADIRLVLEKESIPDDLLITAGDNIFAFDFREFYAVYERKGTDVIVARPEPDIEKLQRAGVVELDSEFLVTGFEEKPQAPKSTYICPALYILKNSTLPLIEDYLTEGGNPDAPGHFIAWLIHQVPVYAYIMSQPYLDIGTLESYKKACESLDSSSPFYLAF